MLCLLSKAVKFLNSQVVMVLKLSCHVVLFILSVYIFGELISVFGNLEQLPVLMILYIHP